MGLWKIALLNAMCSHLYQLLRILTQVKLVRTANRAEGQKSLACCRQSSSTLWLKVEP